MTTVTGPPPPTLRVEKRLLRDGHLLVCGCDEVGRGALAGPVTVGMVLVDVTVRRPLPGVHDSKLLSPAARLALVPRIRRWSVGHAVGHATAGEVDRWGLTAALCLAGHRALRALPAVPDVVVLDGTHNWLTGPPPHGAGPGVGVVTAVKADRRCASVAAASVLAKATRDALMVAMAGHHPGYQWEENKGYASPGHRRALALLGPCPQHRRTWRLGPADGVERPGMAPDGEPLDGQPLDGEPLDGEPLEGVALDGVALDEVALDGVALDGVTLRGRPVDAVQVAGVPGEGRRPRRAPKTSQQPVDTVEQP